MATFTAKLGLMQAAGADPVNVDDNVNENMILIDKYANFFLCTSNNRPAPVAGLKIFETDTGSLLIYMGSAWKYLNPGSAGFANSPKGRITYSELTALNSTLATAEPGSAQHTITFTAEANRYYWIKISYVINCTVATAGRAYLNCRIADGGSVSSASPQLGKTSRGRSYATVGTYRSYTRLFEYQSATAGSKTVGFFFFKDAADGAAGIAVIGNSTSPTRIYIRDVGGV